MCCTLNQLFINIQKLIIIPVEWDFQVGAAIGVGKKTVVVSNNKDFFTVLGGETASATLIYIVSAA